MKIDLNCDLGESFGAYTIGMDADVLPFISSANVACGYHAGDPMVMAKTVLLCKASGAAVGAHPGFPDLMGFGRRSMTVTPTEARNYVLYQIGALNAFCVREGLKLQHVKLHGALYNMAGKDYTLAREICEGVKQFDPDLIMLVLAGSAMQKAAEDAGLKTAKEAFADRAYEDDGSLVARSKPGAVLTDEKQVIARTIQMIKEGTVTSINGNVISLQADSLCVHGDGSKALLFVQNLREAFAKEGIEVRNLRS